MYFYMFSLVKLFPFGIIGRKKNQTSSKDVQPDFARAGESYVKAQRVFCQLAGHRGVHGNLGFGLGYVSSERPLADRHRRADHRRECDRHPHRIGTGAA